MPRITTSLGQGKLQDNTFGYIVVSALLVFMLSALLLKKFGDADCTENVSSEQANGSCTEIYLDLSKENVSCFVARGTKSSH